MADAQVFVVRVWRRRGRFHATLRAPGAEHLRAFCDPHEVSEFLRRACADAATEGGGPAMDEHGTTDDPEGVTPRVRGPPR